MENYYLGLDIGTDSVGYAVTNENYDLMKYKGKPMWGSHIFDAAETSDIRRAFRSARRRLDRKQQRVKLIREIFAEEVAKVDPNFFLRLDESFLFSEDSKAEKGVFVDENYDDKAFHNEYPTIHHLLLDLIENDEPHDIRLVYLACSWLVAHRGHFLSEVSKNNIKSITDFKNAYNNFMDFFMDEKPWDDRDPYEIESILKEKISSNEKKRRLVQYLFGDDKSYTHTEEINTEKIIEMLCGKEIKLSDLFYCDDYLNLDKVSIDIDDERIAQLEDILGNNVELLIKVKAMNDCLILNEILAGEDYISKRKVMVYEQHKKDLSDLKYLIKKYARDKYEDVFTSVVTDNYVYYSGNVKSIRDGNLPKRKTTQDDFNAFLKKILTFSCSSKKDDELLKSILVRVENKSFMPKQKTSDNRVIPYQVYWAEMDAILDNAKKYLPFLSVEDAFGNTPVSKIISTFEFRIPYYVGPLNRHSNFSWVIRTNEPIKPWNFDEVVNLEESEQGFIERLINMCTYYSGEPCLPKMSLTYQKFEVLNEINNIKVNGVYLPVNVKQDLYDNLFEKKSKVSIKDIKNYLVSNGYYTSTDLNTISGLDSTIKSNLKTSIAFKRMISTGVLNYSEVEDIILHSKYCSNKDRFEKWLKKNFSKLSKEDIAYILKIKCQDFGRLSKMFLTGFEGMNKETGEVNTILGFMWNSQCNLMQLLSADYDFVERLEIIRQNYYSNNAKSLNDRLDDLYISNGVKRPIYRTLAIVKDVIKARGGVPKKIFIEMSRGSTPDEKGKRKLSRYQQLIDLYKSVDCEDVQQLQKELESMDESANNRLQSDKLFLYYLQLGKCMYTGKPLKLEQLSNEEIVNIDHIYPQSKVKDDSILNNKVLVLSEVNGKKNDVYPLSAEIRSKMIGFWNYLLKNHLITDEKYRRLVRNTPFTEDEKWGFINRQLVETRQSTKAIATVLKEKYPETEIVYVKAGLVSDFRHEFDIVKSRSVNDLHHAKDAYLNIVVGNVYNSIFTKQWFIENKDSNYSIKTKTLFGKKRTANGKEIWLGDDSLEKVKEIVAKDNACLTKFAYVRKGGLFDQMPVKANSGLAPLKQGLDTSKYGGYNKPTASFYMLVAFELKKNKEVMLVPVELMYSQRVLNDRDFADAYIKEQIKSITNKEITVVNYPLGFRPLKINTVFELDGFKVSLIGKSSGGKSVILSPVMPLCLTQDQVAYVKKLENFKRKKDESNKYVYCREYDYVNPENNLELYDYLINKLKNVYNRRPEINVDKFSSLEKKEKFIDLSIYKQSIVLLNMISVFGRNAVKIPELDFGGGCRLSSKLSNWKYKDVRIVDVSPSGLFSTKTYNLMDLL